MSAAAGVRAAVVLLSLIGVLSALARARFPADLATRLDDQRTRVLLALDRPDPLLGQRAVELQRLDGRFGAHPLATHSHVVAGGVFLLLVPLQFSSGIRKRYIRLHRFTGRLLVLASLPIAASGFFFGLLMPYAGWPEALLIALVGALFLTAVTKAVLAIRRREVARHREWMIRATAVALGISTVRLVAAVLDIGLAPAGIAPAVLFVASLGIGWGLTLGAAELWIAHTRPAAPAAQET